MPESKWGNMLYAEYELGQQIVKNIDFKFVGFRSLYVMWLSLRLFCIRVGLS